MSGPPREGFDPDALREQMQALPGVERAWVEGPPWKVFLFATDEESEVEEAAVHLLSEAGLAADEVAVRVAFAAGSATRRRLRLMESDVLHPSASRVTGRVVLEWGGENHSGEAAAEGGLAADLRATALATLAAIAAVVPAAPAVQLIGIKSVRVFDRDLIVTLLRAADRADANLIGASLVRDGVPIATSRAVLNALNRLLGNYLAVGD